LGIISGRSLRLLDGLRRPQMDGIGATPHRIVASVGIGSFLDGAKVFSSLVWGEGIWGGETGSEDAKR